MATSLNGLQAGRERKMRQRIRGRVFMRSQELPPGPFHPGALVVQIARAALRASAQRPPMLPNRRTVLHPYSPALAARSPRPSSGRGRGSSVGEANDTNCRITLSQATHRAIIGGAGATTATALGADEAARYSIEGKVRRRYLAEGRGGVGQADRRDPQARFVLTASDTGCCVTRTGTPQATRRADVLPLIVRTVIRG
jgi:hypothetical protein